VLDKKRAGTALCEAEAQDGLTSSGGAAEPPNEVEPLHREGRDTCNHDARQIYD